MLAWANTAAGAPMMDTSPTSTSRPTFVMHQLLSVSWLTSAVSSASADAAAFVVARHAVLVQRGPGIDGRVCDGVRTAPAIHSNAATNVIRRAATPARQ